MNAAVLGDDDRDLGRSRGTSKLTYVRIKVGRSCIGRADVAPHVEDQHEDARMDVPDLLVSAGADRIGRRRISKVRGDDKICTGTAGAIPEPGIVWVWDRDVPGGFVWFPVLDNLTYRANLVNHRCASSE